MIKHIWTIAAESSALDGNNAFVQLASLISASVVDSGPKAIALAKLEVLSMWHNDSAPKPDSIGVTYTVFLETLVVFRERILIEMDTPLHRTRLELHSFPVPSSGLYWLEATDDTGGVMARVPFGINVTVMEVRKEESGFTLIPRGSEPNGPAITRR